jgi:Domain of unknown function (DUF4158)
VQSKANPADLINVAIEHLVRKRLELPGYSTLDRMIARVRAEVNDGVFRAVSSRIPADGRARAPVSSAVDASELAMVMTRASWPIYWPPSSWSNTGSFTYSAPTAEPAGSGGAAHVAQGVTTWASIMWVYTVKAGWPFQPGLAPVEAEAIPAPPAAAAITAATAMPSAHVFRLRCLLAGLGL